MFQKGGADAAAGVRRKQVELLNPITLISSRHYDEADDHAVNACKRNTAAGDHCLSDPLADALIGMDQRRACDEFLARPQIDFRDRIRIGVGGASQIWNYATHD